MKNIFNILESDYVHKLFDNKKLIYFPELKDENLMAVEIEKLSPSWAKETCLAKYRLSFSGDIIKIIRGKANLNEAARQTWQIMNYLYSRGFSVGQEQIARPLDFIEENNFLLYEEAPGTPLSLIIQSGDFDRSSACFKKAALWLAKLHAIKADGEDLPAAVFLNSADFIGIFSWLANLFPGLKEDLIPLSALNFIVGLQDEEKNLIHNDFYPGNLIFGQEIVYGIDFEKSGWGSRWLDVATLWGWLAFPDAIQRLDLNAKKPQELQAVFLETYCSACRLDYLSSQQSLKKYLAKIYLDQIYYYSIFCAKGCDFFGAEDKHGYEIKIKALLQEVKQNLR